MLLAAALAEYGAEPEEPATTATRDGDGWRIDGVKTGVLGAAAAELILVPARAGERDRDVPRVAAGGRSDTRRRKRS